MQNTGKTFSIYEISENVTIEELYKKFKPKEQTMIEEKKENYITKITSKTELKSCIFENEENKYFSVSLEIERPKMDGGKSKKEADVLFCYSIEREKILVIPIVTDLQAHIIIRNLENYFKCIFYHIIPRKKKDLFISWMYKKEGSSLKKDEMFLKKIKAYKCTTDDNIVHFRGKSESTLADYLETMQIIISGYDMGYLKLSLAYKEATTYDFILGFYENHNFKVYYNDKILESNLFKNKSTQLELIIFIVNLLIPKMYSIFMEEKWNEKDMLELRLELSNIVINTMLEKKEIILEKLEEIKKEEETLPLLK